MREKGEMMITTEEIRSVLDTKPMGTFVSPKSGVTLIVQQCSYGVVPVESVLDGTSKPISNRSSSDGMGFVSEWHSESDGPESEGVWVEKWDESGCTFHGVVDSVSRKIVQTG